MIEIDGSAGEGGGQVVRTALTLAMSIASPIRIRNIRARRSKPGVRAQHLAAVRAAAAICGARTEGAAIGSRMLTFVPGALHPGHYEIDVGTAGSTMLVLQTILPALSLCNAPSQILLRGGTHNPRAPTFEFIQHAYLPLLARLGHRSDARCACRVLETP
jgi:RNA 3'-terminal phosphate cyclase (ATP)